MARKRRCSDMERALRPQDCTPKQRRIGTLPGDPDPARHKWIGDTSRHGGRETGEVRKILLGDRALAQRYINRARKALGALKHRMAFRNLGQLYHWNTLEDGTRIGVMSIHGQDTLVIDARAAAVTGAGVIEHIACIMETGLAAIEVDFSGAPKAFALWSPPWSTAFEEGLIPPMLIYVGDGLHEYLQSAGTSLPGLTQSEHLLQGAEDGRECPQDPDKSLTDWPDDAVELSIELRTIMGFDGYDAYSSIVYTEYAKLGAFTSACSSPAMFSGLLRLAAQAKLGAGLSPSSLGAWPTAICALQPGRDGLFRDSNGFYWLFRIDATGCYAHRMKVADCMLCVDQWLKNGWGTASDQVQFQALVFASLTVDRRSSDLQIIPAGDLSEVYDNKAALGDIGWSFSYGEHGTGDGNVTEAAIVTHRHYDDGVSSYRIAFMYKIEFDLSGVSPSASLFQEESQQWEPSAGDLIYYPTTGIQGKKQCFVNTNMFSVAQGTDAPIYCFYQKEGIEVFSYTARKSGIHVGVPLPALYCGCGTHRGYGGSGFSQQSWDGKMEARRSDISLARKQPKQASSSYLYKERLISAICGGGAYIGPYTPGITQVGIWAVGGCNNYDVSGWAVNDIYFDITTAYGGGYHKETTVNGIDVKRIAIIPHDDVEAFYLAETLSSTVINQTVTDYEDWSETDPNYVLTAEIVWEKPEEDFYSPVIKVPIQAGTKNSWANVGGVLYGNHLRGVAGTGVPAGSDYTQCEAYLINAHGAIEENEGLSQEYDDWIRWYTYWFNATDNCVNAIMSLQTSFNYGDTWFYTGKSGETALTGNYAIQSPSPANKVAFMGWN